MRDGPKVNGISAQKLEEHKETIANHKVEMSMQLQDVKDTVMAADERLQMTH